MRGLCISGGDGCRIYNQLSLPIDGSENSIIILFSKAS